MPDGGSYTEEIGSGVTRFRKRIFPRRRALFARLVRAQHPKALFLACADSRIVPALGVPHVIICGHSDCGAVKGILHPEAVAALPAVARWLRYGGEAQRQVVERYGDAPEAEQVRRLTRLNVLMQLEHLQTHPSVRAALLAGTLALHGWVYEIDTGEVWAFDPSRGEFVLFPA